MAKRFSIFTALFLLSITIFTQSISAQDMRIGYYSNENVMQAMFEYKQAQEEIHKLRLQYDKEIQRAEDEFNAKYEEFLDSYSSLAPSIRRKRQVELQQMMESNVNFREEAKRLLSQAEEDAIHPIQVKINAALGTIAAQQGLSFILNTDSNAAPYINPGISEDVTSKLLNILVP